MNKKPTPEEEKKLTKEQRFACGYFNIIEAHFKNEEYLGKIRTEEQVIDDIAEGIELYGEKLLTQQKEEKKEVITDFCDWLSNVWSKQVRIPFGSEYAIEQYMDYLKQQSDANT